MGKLEDAKEFLKSIDMPKEQQTDICGYTLLAMAGVKADMSWSEATNEWIGIHDIIQLDLFHRGGNVCWSYESQASFRNK